MKLLRLASYLDEAGEDPLMACKNLKDLGIHYAALRQVWTSNVSILSDQSCATLKSALKRHDVTPIMLATELGNIAASKLMDILKSDINRIFDLVQYFKVPLLRVFVGTGSIKNNESVVKEWMQLIQEKCLSTNIVPVLELTHDSPLFKPTEAVQYLNAYKRWKLLYDPAQIIIRQNCDPFVKYWTLLKSYVAAVDIHDYKIGHGHKPVGYGDTKIKNTLDDSASMNLWYFLEPALGRKLGQYQTKLDTFKVAHEALVTIE